VVTATGTANAISAAGTAGAATAPGEPARRAGASRTQAAPGAAGKAPGSIDSRLLWGVLLAGVGALAYLTVRLLKQPGANGS
jgi:hypothetical protein